MMTALSGTASAAEQAILKRTRVKRLGPSPEYLPVSVTVLPS